MTVVHWNPFHPMTTLHGEINRLLGTARGSQEEALQSWVPAVDIFERNDEVVLRAEVPDVKKDDLDVKIERNVLTLSGEKRRDESIQEDSYHRLERHYGTFVRTFSLPSHVDTSRVEARYKDGILEVVLPKLEEAKPKQIDVTVS